MGKRLKLLEISPEALADLLRLDGTRRVRIEGLPKDAQITYVNGPQFLGRRLLSILVESAEFPELPEGAPLPCLELRVTETWDGPWTPDSPSLINRLGRARYQEAKGDVLAPNSDAGGSRGRPQAAPEAR